MPALSYWVRRSKIHVTHCDLNASKYFYVGSYRLTCLEIALSEYDINQK